MEEPLTQDNIHSRLSRAIAKRDWTHCVDLAEVAGKNRDADAIPCLAALLRNPRRRGKRRGPAGLAGRNLRLAAVDALRKIGNLAAVETLALGLFDSDAAVRRQASQALVAFGERSLSPLHAALERKDDWWAYEMRLVIETLGAIGSPYSGPSLARVLLGIYPRDPSRWFRGAFLQPALILSSITASIGALIGFSNGANFGDCLLSALFGGIFGGIAGIFLFLPLYFFILMPAGFITANGERTALALAAADALIRIQDKNSLPSVIEASYAGRRGAQASARRALCRLLPLIDESDGELLPRASINLLLRSLQPVAESFSPQSPDLTVAILHALRCVGPGSAVETVQKLGQRSDVPQIRVACREILPVLESAARTGTRLFLTASRLCDSARSGRRTAAPRFRDAGNESA